MYSEQIKSAYCSNQIEMIESNFINPAMTLIYEISFLTNIIKKYLIDAINVFTNTSKGSI